MVNDLIGDMAELVARMALERPARGQFLMRATALGDKYPAVDTLVDVLNPVGEPMGFFFAQVKGTTSPPRPSGRLAITVSRDRFNLMVRIPAPVYLIGVDVRPGVEEAYIVAASAPRTARVSSITTAFRLRDDRVRIDLCREVLAYWGPRRPLNTRFTDA